MPMSVLWKKSYIAPTPPPARVRLALRTQAAMVGLARLIGSVW